MSRLTDSRTGDASLFWSPQSLRRKVFSPPKAVNLVESEVDSDEIAKPTHPLPSRELCTSCLSSPPPGSPSPP